MAHIEQYNFFEGCLLLLRSLRFSASSSCSYFFHFILTKNSLTQPWIVPVLLIICLLNCWSNISLNSMLIFLMITFKNNKNRSKTIIIRKIKKYLKNNWPVGRKILVEKIFIAVFLLFKEIGSLFTYLYLLSNVFFGIASNAEFQKVHFKICPRLTLSYVLSNAVL